MLQPRRTFLYWMGMSFLALLLPRCNKAKNNSTPKLPYHHLPDGTFRNLPGAPIREQDPPAGKSSPFTFSRMLKRMFADDEEVIIPKGHALSEKQALAGFYASSKQIQILVGARFFSCSFRKNYYFNRSLFKQPLRYKFFERQKIPESFLKNYLRLIFFSGSRFRF